MHSSRVRTPSPLISVHVTDVAGVVALVGLTETGLAKAGKALAAIIAAISAATVITKTIRRISYTAPFSLCVGEELLPAQSALNVEKEFSASIEVRKSPKTAIFSHHLW